MTTNRVGDVVSVEFPFPDMHGHKRRPGLVLMADEADILLARLTTHPPRGAADVALQQWPATGLPRASTVRLSKLLTLDARLIHHKTGTHALEGIASWRIGAYA
jgi:PemK-like, MazF-like toxin of type II toxin-antitoxin system